MNSRSGRLPVDREVIIHDIARIQLASQAYYEAEELGATEGVKAAVDGVISSTTPFDKLAESPNFGRIRHTILQAVLPEPGVLPDLEAGSSTLIDFMERQPTMRRYGALPASADPAAQAQIIIEAATVDGFDDLGLTEPVRDTFATVTWTAGAMIAAEVFRRDDAGPVGRLIKTDRKYIEENALHEFWRKRPRVRTDGDGAESTVYSDIAALDPDEKHVFGNDPTPRYPHQIFRDQLQTDFNRRRQKQFKRQKPPTDNS